MMIIAKPRTDGFMNVLQVIDVIRELSHSQGFYSRLYRNILLMHERDKEAFDKFTEWVESKNFKDTLDVVMFFEC